MFRSVFVLSSIAIAIAAPAASAEKTLNIIPQGQSQPGSPWLTTPGMLSADTQAKMYNRLTPLFRDIGEAQVTASTDGSGYFKSAALLKVDDPSLITDDTITATAGGKAVSARIRRDNYGVPHIFSDTDAGVTFGAGYVTAADRSLLLNQARYNGIASLADLPGVSGINLVLGLYDYQPSKSVSDAATKQQTDALNAAGAQGKQVLRDIDTYLVGINKWYAANQPSAKPFTRTDIFATNGIKAQFLGEGGGEEISNALFLDAARTTLGTTNGNEAYTNMRGRYDPETMVTTTNKFDYQTDVSVSNPKGLVRLKNGTFKNSYVPLPGATASAAAVKPPGPGRQEASNIMLAAGSKTTTGKPLMVGGPQIGYNYPGLTMEMGLYGPSINVRGATSAPFPGYMLIGRAAKYAWSLTSAGNDIVDTYAETLCGGSKYKYEFKGKCKPMQKINGGTISKGGKTTNVVFYKTVHGSVYGYAKSPGSSKLVALAKRRSSYGRETTDLLFYQQMTFGRVNSAKSFVAAAAKTPQTFNSFYSSDKEIAFITSGLFPMRPKGVNMDLPVDGRGKYEWTGYLSHSKHPQVINPASGYIVNWNGKPAKNFPAGDERWGENSLQRGQLLNNELARQSKQSLATMLSAANAGATEDVRIALLWPTLKKVLDKGTAPNALAAAAVAQLQAWHEQGASRVDSNQDGKIDAPGAAIIDQAWQSIAGDGLCWRMGTKLCEELAQRNGGSDAFDAPPGGQYGGWHQYMWKDLRNLLGEKVNGAYKIKYCGKGSLDKCSADIWDSISEAAAALATAQGSDPAAWRKAEAPEQIKFSPVPLITMDYTNRPSGIHQLMDFSD
jgi:acyl-homoserine lactone acylase PvdQ